MSYQPNPKDEIASNYTELAELEKEAALFLHDMDVTPARGKKHINFCNKCFQLDNASIKNLLIDGFNIDAFFPLFKDAIDLRNEILMGKPKAKCITALRIVWGADNANKIRPLYQPLCLVLKTKGTIPDANHNLENLYLVSEKNIKSYISENGTFKEYKPLQVGDFEAIYKSKIKFDRKQTGMGPWYPFNYLTDINGDVKSQMFPFQEIFGLMAINKVEKIWLYNSARWLRQGKIVKHTIYLSPEEISMEEKTKPTHPFALLGMENLNAAVKQELLKLPLFNPESPLELEEIYTHDPTEGETSPPSFGKRSFANLAHLCPPNCIKFRYVME